MQVSVHAGEAKDNALWAGDVEVRCRPGEPERRWMIRVAMPAKTG